MGLIRFAVIFFLVWLITSLFTRYVLPFVLRLLFRRMSGRVKRDYDKKMRDKQRKEREGEVTIRYRPDKTKIIDKGDGEYVDYEDLDNN